MIGPAIAGVLIALVGAGLCFVVNAISFLSVLISLRLMREEELHPVEKRPETRVVAGIREGFAWAFHAPVARIVLTVDHRRQPRRLQLPRARPAPRLADARRRRRDLRDPRLRVRARRARRRARDRQPARGDARASFVGGATGFSVLMVLLALIDSVSARARPPVRSRRQLRALHGERERARAAQRARATCAGA